MYVKTIKKSRKMSLSEVKIVALFRKEVPSVCRGLLLNLGGCLLGCSLYYCEMWSKMESLKLKILKWSQESTKRMSLMHILTKQNTNFLTRQNHTYCRILQKQVQLVTETYFCLMIALAIDYVQPRLAFCQQHQLKFFVNDLDKLLLLPLRTSGFVPQ